MSPPTHREAIPFLASRRCGVLSTSARRWRNLHRVADLLKPSDEAVSAFFCERRRGRLLSLSRSASISSGLLMAAKYLGGHGLRSNH